MTLGQVYKNTEKRGDIKVNKTFMVPLDRIYEEDGFNIRDHEEHNIERMADAFWEHEQLPPVVVETQPNGKFKLIDGHRRRLGALRCNEKYGQTITHLECKESTAKSELDQLVFMVGTTNNIPLKPWETSVIAKRLSDHGLDLKEIGTVIDRGLSNVKHHIAVASLPASVFELVKQGKIQDSLAVEINRKQGEQAVHDALSNAGNNKVKRSHTKLWTSKTGKESVSLLSTATITHSDSTTSFTVPKEDAELLLKAIEMLKLEKGDEN